MKTTQLLLLAVAFLPPLCLAAPHEATPNTLTGNVMGSEDFKARMAKSKFGAMPLFAKSGKGYRALQGDHGSISFRNIKVRPL